MKVTEAQFTWNVPYGSAGDTKRIFRERDGHVMEYLVAERLLVIDGRCVSPDQAVWLPAEPLFDVVPPQEPRGTNQPSGTVGPARGPKRGR